jgi:porphobilinogen deaminase
MGVDIAVHSMKDVPTALPGRLFKPQFWKSATLDILVSGNLVSIIGFIATEV